MYYQILIHNVFLMPDMYNAYMEHDKTQILKSPLYAANSKILDEYLVIDELFTDMIIARAKMTKHVKADGTEQVVQIETTSEKWRSFAEHPEYGRMQELRVLAGQDILRCFFIDIASSHKEPLVTFASFDEAITHF